MSIYPRTSITPGGTEKKKDGSIYPTTSAIEPDSPPQRRERLYQPTALIPHSYEPRVPIVYKLVLTDYKGFEETILESAESRTEAYDAYKAWFAEFQADPMGRIYPPDTWAVCTRNGELSWKTNPFVRDARA